MDDIRTPFTDCWTTARGQDAGYTLDYEKNKNAMNRADVARASKYEHKALRDARVFLYSPSNGIKVNSVDLFGTNSKQDGMGRATGIYPTDHFGVTAAFVSAKGDFELTGGMPWIAVMFLTLAAVVCFTGCGYFAYTQATGKGGSDEETQKLTGDAEE